jgi:hypothetical protein
MCEKRNLTKIFDKEGPRLSTCTPNFFTFAAIFFAPNLFAPIFFAANFFRAKCFRANFFRGKFFAWLFRERMAKTRTDL